ncbi:MAG: hypothetical protein KF872_04190 [Chitinophagales bacterium]|nr:hypothetical protein [Chitinophagales bacterium]
MKTRFYKLFAVFSALSFSAVTVLGAGKSALDVRNMADATALIKVLNKELSLSEQQKVRIGKLMEAYMRRVELAKIAYADNDAQLNKRLMLLTNFRNETLKKELGDEKTALFEIMLPELPKKMAEMKKRISGN